jgi:hypothetical protein
MRIVECIDPAVARGEGNRLLVRDKVGRTSTWIALNLAAVSVAVAFRGLLSRSVPGAALLAIVWLAANILMVWRRLLRAGDPVALVIGEKLLLRVVSNAGPRLWGKYARPPEVFVEFERSELERVSARNVSGTKAIERVGCGCRCGWPPGFEEQLLDSLRKVRDRPPSRLWLLTYEAPRRYLFRWYPAFTPDLGEWLTRVAQSWPNIDSRSTGEVLDLREFSRLGEEEQRGLIWNLTALGLKILATTLVKIERKVSYVKAARFVEDALAAGWRGAYDRMKGTEEKEG